MSSMQAFCILAECLSMKKLSLDRVFPLVDDDMSGLDRVFSLVDDMDDQAT